MLALIPFQGLIITRAVNYAVVPFIAKVSRIIEYWWANLSPESRRKFYSTSVGFLWPLCSLVDMLRFALVRLYVIDPAAAGAVWGHSRAINSIVFQNKSLAVKNWNGEKKTRSFAFPLVLALTPLFYAADMSRSVAADKIYPAKHQIVEYHCEEMWQNSFASISRN